MSASTRQDVSQWHLELAAKFAARRCKKCGAPATVVVIGSVARREVGITLVRAKPDQNLCIAHAGLLSERAA